MVTVVVDVNDFFVTAGEAVVCLVEIFENLFLKLVWVLDFAKR